MGHIAKKLNFKKLQKHYNDPKRSGAYSGAAALQQSIKLKLAVVKKRKKVTTSRYTVHKLIRKMFKRRSIIVDGIDQQFQSDFVD